MAKKPPLVSSIVSRDGNVMKQVVGSWQLSGLCVPQLFAAYADAYLDSAKRLCKVLKVSPRKASYERGAVVIYLTFHSVELFLKAAVLQKAPSEKLNHNIEHYGKRYRKLYPGKIFNFEIPFKTEYVGFEPPEIEKLKSSEPAKDQMHRYPTDRKGKEWSGVFAFDPVSFLSIIEGLNDDFKRLKGEIFSANKSLESDA